MFRTVLILFAVVVFVAAAPVNEDAQADIIYNYFKNDGSGNYMFSYRTSNGLFREEKGEVVDTGTENEHIVVRGTYSYTDPDGHIQRVRYIADENGYQILTPELLLPPATLPPAVVASLLGG